MINILKELQEKYGSINNLKYNPTEDCYIFTDLYKKELSILNRNLCKIRKQNNRMRLLSFRERIKNNIKSFQYYLYNLLFILQFLSAIALIIAICIKK